MTVFYENIPQTFLFQWRRKLQFSGAHVHNQIELVMMLDGEARVWVDSREYTLRGGDALIVFPNQVHEYLDLGGCRSILLICPPDRLPELADTFHTRIPACAVVRADDLLPLARQAIREHHTRHPYRDTAVQGYLLALISELLNRMPFDRREDTASDSIRKVLEFCSSHYHDDISLEILEQELYMSRYTISHLFSERLHVGFNEYINSLRVFEACRRLKSETIGVTELAQQVGFASLRTFNRAFRKQTGMTPSEYRKA